MKGNTAAAAPPLRVFFLPKAANSSLIDASGFMVNIYSIAVHSYVSLLRVDVGAWYRRVVVALAPVVVICVEKGTIII